MIKNFIYSLFLGFIAGFICGFFGAGGGLILIPYMTLILKMDEVKSRATSILIIFALVLVCSIFYLKHSNIDWNIGIKCAIGGSIGSFIGSKLLNKIDKKWLQITFIIFLIYCGLKLIIS